MGDFHGYMLEWGLISGKKRLLRSVIWLVGCWQVGGVC